MVSDIYNEQVEQSRIGEAMENLEVSPDFAVFKEQVLKQIETQAFEVFKAVPADDHVAIVGAQQMGKVVDIIYNKMNALIEEGKLNREYLKNSNPE